MGMLNLYVSVWLWVQCLIVSNVKFQTKTEEKTEETKTESEEKTDENGAEKEDDSNQNANTGWFQI